MDDSEAPDSARTPARAPRLARLCASCAGAVVVATYAAAQVDLWRRHRPGIAPEVYLLPQATQIWLPGLAGAALLAAAAVWLRRRST